MIPGCYVSALGIRRPMGSDRAAPAEGTPKAEGCPSRIPDRAALGGIIFVLRSGAPPGGPCRPSWAAGAGPPAGGAFGTGRRTVWGRLHATLFNWIGDGGGIDWSRASVDSISVHAKRGGDDAGPNQVDRGKLHADKAYGGSAGGWLRRLTCARAIVMICCLQSKPIKNREYVQASSCLLCLRRPRAMNSARARTGLAEHERGPAATLWTKEEFDRDAGLD